MKDYVISIRNAQNELLNTLISGNEDATTAIVFAHGLGSNKDENTALFVDIADTLKETFQTIRFDFSGYGQSEGKQKDVDLYKMRGDLHAVVQYALENYKKVFIIAHSMGTFATLLLKPFGVERIIFTSPPNTNPHQLIQNMQTRITKNGGIVNEEGITLYKRTNGDEQEIGPTFWTSMRDFNPIELTKALSHYAPITIIDPANDEVVKHKSTEHLKVYKTLGIQCKELPGDHNFTDQKDRYGLITEINTVFRKRKIVFIAHPISGDGEKNIQKVIEICKNVHDHTVIPVFPSLLWRHYLNSTQDSLDLTKELNEELFKRKGIDEVWYYGDTLSKGMVSEANGALKYGIPNIGKTLETARLLTQLVDVK